MIQITYNSSFCRCVCVYAMGKNRVRNISQCCYSILLDTQSILFSLASDFFFFIFVISSAHTILPLIRNLCENVWERENLCAYHVARIETMRKVFFFFSLPSWRIMKKKKTNQALNALVTCEKWKHMYEVRGHFYYIVNIYPIDMGVCAERALSVCVYERVNEKNYETNGNVHLDLLILFFFSFFHIKASTIKFTHFEYNSISGQSFHGWCQFHQFSSIFSVYRFSFLMCRDGAHSLKIRLGPKSKCTVLLRERE